MSKKNWKCKIENFNWKYALKYALIFVVVLFPFVYYSWNFWSYSVSNNPNDWGAFGSYLGGTYAFINVLALLLLTYVANKINTNIAETQLKQSIYSAYFDQINSLFFDVILKYNEYEKDTNHENEENLENILGIYVEYIKNLKNETKDLDTKFSFNEIIDKIVSNANDFKEKFSTSKEDDRKQYFNYFIKYKTELINSINKTILKG